jgi:hypothetical protein|tara:strand:+ start:2689 stop:3069 length:381 start_codon:yes stop_codon:yes gene_type:complete
VAVEKEPLDRPRLGDHPTQDPEKRDQIHAPNPTVPERAQATAVSRGVEVSDESGRSVSQHSEQRADRGQYARDPTKRQSRRAERHHFPVGRGGVATNDLHRVDRRFGVVERVVQPVQWRLETEQRG